MKISDLDLTKLEEQRKVTVIQSDFWDVAYAVDRKRNAMWLINRKTGAEIEIDGENAYKFVDEIMSIADLYLNSNNIQKGA